MEKVSALASCHLPRMQNTGTGEIHKHVISDDRIDHARAKHTVIRRIKAVDIEPGHRIAIGQGYNIQIGLISDRWLISINVIAEQKRSPAARRNQVLHAVTQEQLPVLKRDTNIHHAPEGTGFARDRNCL